MVMVVFLAMLSIMPFFLVSCFGLCFFLHKNKSFFLHFLALFFLELSNSGVWIRAAGTLWTLLFLHFIFFIISRLRDKCLFAFSTLILVISSSSLSSILIWSTIIFSSLFIFFIFWLLFLFYFLYGCFLFNFCFSRFFNNFSLWGFLFLLNIVMRWVFSMRLYNDMLLTSQFIYLL